ncbi:hypothetical protein GCM10009808_17630 [Microbacterium sediminicola]|uniref:Ribulose-phosphate 3-epimerase n=1 Tax=Microbacterium sediminicola TaxID=415210 RepID=A0ABN2I8G5_9MICO
MLEVAGSLWSVPPETQLSEASRLAAAGMRRLHWDMSDGAFAAAGGFGPDDALAISEATGCAAEAHIMATTPLREVDAWAEFCDLVIVHVESEGWRACIDRVTARGSRPGLAISPQTPIEQVPHQIATLCMSITPGQAGSAFDPSTLARVAALRDRDSARPIGIDGGIRREFAEGAVDAGATWLAVGGDLFGPGGERRWSDLLRRT